ncbi:MAG: tetratricopeptide repeat protein, partial [Xanthobacteraceae bacterium]
QVRYAESPWQARPIASGQYEGHGLAKLHFNCAIEHRQKGDYDRAIADFSEAIRLDPKDAAVYNNRGNAWRAKGDNDRAIADYNEAIRLDPKDPVFYRNRGMAYKATRGFDRALWDYSKANALEREIRH